MEKFKKELKKVYDEATRDKNHIYSIYDKYLNKEARDKYTEQFLKPYIEERASRLEETQRNAEIKFYNVLNDYRESLLPKIEVIDTLDHQLKLSNVLRILSMKNVQRETNVDVSMFDFLVEARNMTVLKEIKSIYNNYYIQEYYDNNSYETLDNIATQLTQGAIKALNGGDDYSSRLAIYNMEHISEDIAE